MSALLLSPVVAFVVALIVTPCFRQLSRRLRYLDIPDEISAHRVAVPKTGGYAIFIGVIVATGVTGALSSPDIRVIATGATVLAMLAAVDETTSLPRAGRFCVQIAVAAAAAYVAQTVLRQVELPLGLVPSFGPLAWVVTVAWIVGLINAYNFMDGLNGLASVEGIIGGITLAALSVTAGDAGGAILALAIAGACTGFLPWNLPNGSIFMGDVGSVSLGFFFALLSLRLAAEGIPIVVTALPLLPFLLDSSVTVMRRALCGERFFTTRHRSHFYQRLNVTGFSHGQVVAVYGGLALLGSLAAMRYSGLSEGGKAATLVGVVGAHIAVAAWITAREGRWTRLRGDERQR